MEKQTKKRAPTGAKETLTAGKRPAYSEPPKKDNYAGKPAETSKPYAGQESAGYDSKTVDGLKDALYRVAEASYQLKSREPLSDTTKKSIKAGIEGLVDAALLIGKADPKLAYGLQAVLFGDAATKQGIESQEGRHYLSQLAAGFAEKGGLKAYEKPDGMKPNGYAGPMPGASPYGGLPPDLGQLLASYFGQGSREATYGKKTG